MKWFLLLSLLLPSVCGFGYSPWSVEAPRTVEGAEGSCLMIPCKCRYPSNSNIQAVMWLKGEKVNGTLVISSNGDSDRRFKNRATLVGDWRTGKDCSLKIKNLQKSDEGIYHFRMTGPDTNKYSDPNGVSIIVVDAPELVKISAPAVLQENVPVSLNCSVSFLCPGWLRWIDTEGLNISSSHREIRQSPTGSTILKFTPSYRDHGRSLRCGFKTGSGEMTGANVTLNVLYAPKDVYVNSRQYTPFRVGQYVALQCLASSSNPPVQSYTWYTGSTMRYEHGALKQVRIRHSQQDLTFRCEARNSVGTASSDVVKLEPLEQGSWAVWSPLVVRARTGSCVVIPCEFTHPHRLPGKVERIGMWLQDHHFSGDKVYHNDGPGKADYQRRVEFLGDLESGNCTLKMKNLTSNDSRNYYFRIEIGVHKWSHQSGSRLVVSDLPEKPDIIGPMTVQEGIRTTMTCSVRSPCPEDIPVLTWVSPFTEVSEMRSSYQDNLWNYSRSISFTPQFEDLVLTLRCLAHFGTDIPAVDTEVTLSLQYKPRNVSISLTEGYQGRLQEGDSVTLRCDVLYTQPAVTGYSWYQDGVQLPSAWGQTTEIRDITYSQFGEYFCEARNTIGSGRSEGIELRGQYKPRDFQTVHSVNGDDKRDLTSVNERDTVNISCTSQNSDPAVSGYSWYRHTQNKPVSGQILLFESISKDDSGNYQCEARNNVGTGRSHTITIRVQYAPTSVRITFPSSVRAGTWTSLSCQSDGHPAASSYHWRKVCPHGLMSLCSGSQWRSQCSFYASVQDVGCEFICTARNSMGEKDSDPIRLDIQYGPRNVEIISEDTVMEGTEITLTCRGEANPPVHTYSWGKMCNRQRKDLRENTDTIRIQPTRNDASCSYICTARNSVTSRDSTPKHINVQYGPGDVTIVRNEPRGEVKERERVTLTCNSRSNPGALYTWYKDSVNTAANKGTGNILTIRSITPTDSGDYYCKAENVIGRQTSKSFRIEVLYAPRNMKVSISPSDSAIYDGDNITLSCTSDSNPPTSWYKWVRSQGGRSVTLPSFRRDLTLYRITSKQEGVYSCEAGNTVGANKSEGRRIEVVRRSFRLLIGISMGLLGSVITVVLVVMCYRRKWKKTDSTSPQCIEATNTVYSVVMKRNQAKERTVYENLMMTESTDSQGHTPPDDPVEYATINFGASSQTQERQKQTGATRGKGKKPLKARPDNDPTVIYSLIKKAPPPSQVTSDDYENVVHLFAKGDDSSEDELNYTSVLHLNSPGNRPHRRGSRDDNEYTSIKF
ncbi:B-cell receptor CD22-like [Hemiscyllium ocellatum]|uniref:B-cell receptor CD22-like n=1 Tax=Hemiscyllium ocellatum TaxID=170820 RepID=UPI00296643A6|nr:B-cell receptor CD22-like [Hemiscyllium ocellatum]